VADREPRGRRRHAEQASAASARQSRRALTNLRTCSTDWQRLVVRTIRSRFARLPTTCQGWGRRFKSPRPFQIFLKI
jgi:hypothetical protein